jgi:ribonuclease HI
VWALEQEEIVEHLSEMHEEDARAWVAALIKSVPHGDLIRVVVTMWAIWYARRKAIHENIFQSPLSTHSFVNNYVSDLLASKPPRAVKASVQTRHPKWLPPPAGCTKVNVDAAISKNLGRASVAAVARDQTGMFLGASGVVLEGITDVETAEAIACREGLALASDLTLQSIRLASDSANVIRSLEETGMGPYGQVVKEVKARARDLNFVDFAHENRSSNVDAHNLARSLISFVPGRHVWLLTPPEGVCNSYDQLN